MMAWKDICSANSIGNILRDGIKEELIKISFLGNISIEVADDDEWHPLGNYEARQNGKIGLYDISSMLTLYAERDIDTLCPTIRLSCLVNDIPTLLMPTSIQKQLLYFSHVRIPRDEKSVGHPQNCEPYDIWISLEGGIGFYKLSRKY